MKNLILLGLILTNMNFALAGGGTGYEVNAPDTPALMVLKMVANSRCDTSLIKKQMESTSKIEVTTKELLYASILLNDEQRECIVRALQD